MGSPTWLPPRYHQDNWPSPVPFWGWTVDPCMQKPQHKSPQPPPGLFTRTLASQVWKAEQVLLTSRLLASPNSAPALSPRWDLHVLRVPLELRAHSPVPGVGQADEGVHLLSLIPGATSLASWEPPCVPSSFLSLYLGRLGQSPSARLWVSSL